MKRRWFWWSTLAAVLLALAGHPATGQPILLEGFEAGVLPPGWAVAPGSVFGTSGSVTNLGPTQGSLFGFIDTRGTASTAFTGVAGATEGSVLLSAPFSAGAGDVLSLDLAFLTNDGGGFNDFALVELLPSGGGMTIAVLYSAQTVVGSDQAVPPLGSAPGISAGVVLTPATANFGGVVTGPLSGVFYGPTKFGGGKGGTTGFVNSSFVIPATGSFQLRFAVSDVGDPFADSALAIDNITLASMAIPEPASLGLFALALSAGLAYGRKRRRTTGA